MKGQSSGLLAVQVLDNTAAYLWTLLSPTVRQRENMPFFLRGYGQVGGGGYQLWGGAGTQVWESPWAIHYFVPGGGGICTLRNPV